MDSIGSWINLVWIKLDQFLLNYWALEQAFWAPPGLRWDMNRALTDAFSAALPSATWAEKEVSVKIDT